MARKQRSAPSAAAEVAARFEAKVEKTNGCWWWRGTVSNNGYGMFHVGLKSRNHSESLHRFAYRLWVGEIPEGMTVDHACNNRLCVNPMHLSVMTQHENNAKGTSPSALNAIKTHCIHGHAFTRKNTHVDKRGRRVCRACKRAEARRRRQRVVFNGA